MTGCPNDETLAQLGSDSLADRFGSLEQHIQDCERCQRVLERLAAEGSESAGVFRRGSQNPPDLPGFEISREINRGAMGIVFEARETDLARTVAIKFVGGGLAASEPLRRRWLREAQAIATVTHPNVVPIYQVGEQDDWLYLVLKFVPRGTLGERLDKPLPPAVAAKLMEAVARGVEAVHQAQFIHLDVKPSNILLDGPPDGDLSEAIPLLADFGLARFQGDPGQAVAGIIGTPWYMAPEQASGERDKIGPAADIYALGATLYHLMTGRPPFQAASVAETLDQVRDREPVPPRVLNPAIPPDLETICLVCLNKAPGRRYNTALEMADDLRRWQDGRPIRARRASAAEHAWCWCRRNPAVAGLTGSLAASLFVMVIGLLALLNRAERLREKAAIALRQAENYERFSARAADGLNELVARTVTNSSVFREGEALEMLRKLGNSTTELRRNQGADPAIMGCLEHRVASGLIFFGKIDEAEVLIGLAVEDLAEGFRRDPVYWPVRGDYAGALYYAGMLAEARGQFADALDHYDRSAEVSLGRDGRLVNHEMLLDLSQKYDQICRETNATSLLKRARTGRDRVAARLLASPPLGASGAGAIPEERSGRRPGADAMLQKYEAFLAVQLSRAVEHADTFDYRIFEREDGSLPDAWAGEIISSLRRQAVANPLGISAVPKACVALAELAQQIGAAGRKSGRLDDAHRVAGRLIALARALVREFPNRPESYLVLSVAHEQIAKNAWQVGDAKSLLTSRLKSVEAAREALRIDPASEKARRQFDILERRLVADREEFSGRTPTR